MKRRYVILIVVLILAAGGYPYFNHIDRMVQDRFQGRLWELPARVYARPMEVYQGLRLNPDGFEKELALTGYKKTKDLPGQPGAYLRQDGQFHVYLRAFDFADEKRNARRIQINIQNNVVTRFKHVDQDTAADGDADLGRIDPVVLGSFYPDSKEDRILVSIDQLPRLLVQAIVAVEDKNFFSHPGIDIKSIIRALAVDIKTLSLSQGASTLTQQLARNFFLTSKKSLVRKVNEAATALVLELRFSKAQILEAYINEVYLGQDGRHAVHGFGLAAQFYFGKSVQNLKPHEIALLVGMLKGPSAYNPRRHPEKALSRRNLVLRLMGGQVLLTGPDIEKAIKTPLGVVEKTDGGQSPFPCYLDLVKRRLMDEYRAQDLKTMGLRIFTTLDPQVQLAAESGTAGFLHGQNPALEAAVVVTTTATNEIQAVVGGKDFRLNGFNRALDARRPVGSLIKPAVYLTALQQPEKYTLMTPIDDGPVSVKTSGGGLWEPQNYDKIFHGQIPLYQALVHSYNVATVRIGMDTGLDKVARTLQKMGAEIIGDVLPSMLLGSLEMSPFQVAQFYHTLASGGFFIPAKCIRAVYTQDGHSLNRYPLSIEQRLDPGAVFLVNRTLQAAVARGTGSSLERWIPRNTGVAGKTGTSNDLKDSWFAGFTGDHLAVVWVGRDDNNPAGLTGSSGALQAFGRIMSRLPEAPLSLTPPENVVWGVINPDTGQLTDDTCPDAVAVPFIKGSGPTEYSPCGRGRRAGSTPGSIKPRNFIDWLKEIF